MKVQPSARSTLAALVALTAFAPPAHAADEPSPYQSISLDRLAPAEAVKKFSATCLPGFPDARSFRNAMASTVDPYVKLDTPDAKHKQLWRSRSTFVNYAFAVPGKKEPAIPQCNFDAVAPEAVDREYVAQLVERALDSAAGIRAVRKVHDGYYSWSWQGAGKQPIRLLYIFGPPLKAHQISLSLQVWNETE